MRLIDTGKASAQANMDYTRQLLLQTHVEPLLHLYEWNSGSISHGFAIAPWKYLNQATCQKENIDVVARPTGGGIVLHDYDYTFSLFLPSTHPLSALPLKQIYHKINQQLQQILLKSFSIEPMLSMTTQSGPVCCAAAVEHDLVCHGKKLLGAALRKNNKVLLYQGSIALTLPSYHFLSSVFLDTAIVEAIMTHATSLTSQGCSLPLLEQKVLLSTAIKELSL